ncbi:DUF4249 domain-containing protein, partial [Bacteroidales bacterium OttesenSCG-928-C19]|nr:DUF4249 domain-containing protein [Bacteroidales bacterium OttesenSCG-928-C19]
MQKYITLFLLLITFSGCEKEIDFKYNSIDKLYIIEGRLNNETTEVIITQTQDMDEIIGSSGLDNAIVTITSDNGITETLQYEDDGYYRSPSEFTGNPGGIYTLSVSIDNELFSSRSTMNKQTQIDTVYFQWLKIVKERMMMCVVEIQDIPDEDNYYCYYMYRNGEKYTWGLLNDRGNDGKVMEEYIFCMWEENENDDEYILHEGDEISIEIHTIDQRAFDYLYSLMLSNRTSSNPISNFKGNCL